MGSIWSQSIICSRENSFGKISLCLFNFYAVYQSAAFELFTELTEYDGCCCLLNIIIQ